MKQSTKKTTFITLVNISCLSKSSSLSKSDLQSDKFRAYH